MTDAAAFPPVPPPTAPDRARDLAEDLALCEAATPGPWAKDVPCYALPWEVGRALLFDEAARRDVICTLDVRYGHTDDAPRALDADYLQVMADARFIAAARAGWPAAVRRAAAAEAEAVRLRAALAALHDAAIAAASDCVWGSPHPSVRGTWRLLDAAAAAASAALGATHKA